MTDITIYKPASVTVRLVNGQYVIVNKPPWMTIQAINGQPPAAVPQDQNPIDTHMSMGQGHMGAQ